MHGKSWTTEEEEILQDYTYTFPEQTNLSKAEIIHAEGLLNHRTEQAISVRFSVLKSRKKEQKKNETETIVRKKGSEIAVQIATAVLNELTSEERKKVFLNFL